jgi:hypothetical protein
MSECSVAVNETMVAIIDSTLNPTVVPFDGSATINYDSCPVCGDFPLIRATRTAQTGNRKDLISQS